MIATLTKGYDLDYVWKQVDQVAVKSAASYYLQPGSAPPGPRRWT